jgi:predicted sulfurtransferase
MSVAVPPAAPMTERAAKRQKISRCDSEAGSYHDAVCGKYFKSQKSFDEHVRGKKHQERECTLSRTNNGQVAMEQKPTRNVLFELIEHRGGGGDGVAELKGYINEFLLAELQEQSSSSSSSSSSSDSKKRKDCATTVSDLRLFEGGVIEQPQQHEKKISEFDAAFAAYGVDGVLLYYKYVTITDPQALRQWQMALCTALGLKGRVIIGKEGINGTVGGPAHALKLYIIAMMAHGAFQGSAFTLADFKTGLGRGGADSFPIMYVAVRAEICLLGVDSDEVVPSDLETHLTPGEFHERLTALAAGDEKERDTVLIDCRNTYESDIGSFDSAVRPVTRKFQEWPAICDDLINSHDLKNKQVLMFCTGGIRCERGSAVLRRKGVENVQQLHGGIHKYLQQFPDEAESRWKGKLFVFDRRKAVAPPTDGPVSVVGSCITCSSAFDQYDSNVRCSECKVLVLMCLPCRAASKHSQQKQGKVTAKCAACAEESSSSK